MILLHEPPLIFLKPHKVAGTSFEIALSSFAGPRDIITPYGKVSRADEMTRQERGYTSPQNYAYPWYRLPFVSRSEWRFAYYRRQLPKRFRNHLPAAQIKQRLGADIWSRSLKVSIVRCPFDRAVSAYFWRRKPDEDFGAYLVRDLRYLCANDRHYRIGGEDCVDVYLRYEHIAGDIAALERRLPELAGLGAIFAGLSAKSGHRPKAASVREMFASAPGAVQIIEDNFQFEIERFGYRLKDCH